MSAVPVVYEDILDLNDKKVLCMLASLETELNQLHKLGQEQGMFFKAIFPEAVSDIDRSTLKNQTTHHSPNVSHMSRSYWKTTIFIRDIQNIRRKGSVVRQRWIRAYATLPNLTTDPTPQNDMSQPDTSLSDLNKTLTGLCVSIELLCWDLEKCRVYQSQRSTVANPLSAPLNKLLRKLKTTQ